jgi:hypothetical protein
MKKKIIPTMRDQIMARDLKASLGKQRAIDFVAERRKATTGQLSDYWAYVHLFLTDPKKAAWRKKLESGEGGA